jgi:predicted acylesterase/phospholipase RssA
MKESNIWPDYVIGSSAGALACAHLAYNDENVEKILNEGNIAKAFSLTRNILTPIISFGNGIAGYSFHKLLKKAFDQTKMKDVADCFIVTVVPPWRTNIIGCSSNGEIMFSKDMLLANAVYASCSIPGIIKQYCEINAELNKLWFENDEVKHAKTIKEYAMFEDGAVTQPLPIITALTIARKLDKKALIIAINLNELNPIKNGEPYFKLKEIINILKEEEKIKEKLREKEEKRREGTEEKTEKRKEERKESKIKAIKTAINKIKNGLKSALTTIKIYIEALAYFIKQKKKIMISKIAPIRAFNAYKAMETHSIINILRNVKNFLKKGEGLIIINPNANGELEGVKLNDKKGMEKIAQYGYKIGKEFASILLLKTTHENRNKK